MAIGVIDIGGTSIKFGIHQQPEELINLPSIPTPDNLDDFLTQLTAIVAQMKADYQITGVGVSSPGAVDTTTGIIGGASAVPYIHNFDIVSVLRERFELPVSIENDANCAALAELSAGAARDFKDVVVLVLGTGVGGALILDGKIRHGAHLLAGEYGYMLNDEAHIVSEHGTIVNALTRYNQAHANAPLESGEALYAAAQVSDNDDAQREVTLMLQTIAKTIFNLQYAIDPECFVLAGGISQNPRLLDDVNRALDTVMTIVDIAPVRPEVRVAQFHAAANLYGAAANFYQTI